MTPDLAKRLARVFPSLSVAATGVAGVAGVAEVARYVRKPQQLRPLRPLRLEIDKRGSEKDETAAAPLDPVADAIKERRAIIADNCPAPYADIFARLNHQRPLAVSTQEWDCAVNDAGLFLDAWGALAVEFEWTAGDLFEVPREGRPGGLIWQAKGEHVEALGADHARLADGRTIIRSEEIG